MKITVRIRGRIRIKDYAYDVLWRRFGVMVRVRVMVRVTATVRVYG